MKSRTLKPAILSKLNYIYEHNSSPKYFLVSSQDYVERDQSADRETQIKCSYVSQFLKNINTTIISYTYEDVL